MPLLAGILSALALLLAVATIVGVIAPSLFRNRKTGQVPKRLSVLVWGCIAVLVAMILAGSQVPPPPAPPAAGRNAGGRFRPGTRRPGSVAGLKAPPPPTACTPPGGLPRAAADSRRTTFRNPSHFSR